MRVSIEDKINFDNYTEFIKKYEFSTFYHSEKFLKFLENLLKTNSKYVIASNGNQIVGVLPFFEKKSSYGKVVNSLPFFGSYGGIISESNDVKKEILEEFNSYNKKNDILSSVIISNPFDSLKDHYEKYFSFNTKEERRIQCIDLKNETKEHLWTLVEQRVRRAIRKSEKNNVSVIESSSDDVIDKFYRLHKKTMEEKNAKPKSYEFFNNLKKNFEENENYNIYVAKKDDELIAFLLVFYFNSFTEYYIPVFNYELRNLQPTSILIWKSLERSIEKKIRYYNFGGTWSDQNELYLFKRGWNANDISYNYYIYRDLDRINDLGLDTIKNNFENFYVTKYDEITQN